MSIDLYKQKGFINCCSTFTCYISFSVIPKLSYHVKAFSVWPLVNQVTLDLHQNNKDFLLDIWGIYTLSMKPLRMIFLKILCKQVSQTHTPTHQYTHNHDCILVSFLIETKKSLLKENKMLSKCLFKRTRMLRNYCTS